MASQSTLLETLALGGLEIAPSQVCGSIRLVPLLRREGIRGDLRLTQRPYQDNYTIVSLGGPSRRPNGFYCGYVPHGMVLNWTGDGSALAARGTQLTALDPNKPRDGKTFGWDETQIRVMPRMVKREAKNQLRFLPMHLAMEGYLSLHFGGPDIAWAEYSRRALAHGLDPRWEMVYGGSRVAGFEDALRTFEMHTGQVGVLVFVADALASAFVTPHPDDYRSLHRTLLADFYGELIVQYGLLYDTVTPLKVDLDADAIPDLTALRAALAGVRRDWAEFQGFMASDLLGRSIKSRRTYQAGPFTLQRFLTDLDPSCENHMGEAIVRDDGTLEYLKTFRLSAAQTRRAYLLSRLSAALWNLDDAAEDLQTTRHELVHRMEKAGFGYLLAEPVRVASAKHQRSLLRQPYKQGDPT